MSLRPRRGAERAELLGEGIVQPRWRTAEQKGEQRLEVGPAAVRGARVGGDEPVRGGRVRAAGDV